MIGPKMGASLHTQSRFWLIRARSHDEGALVGVWIFLVWMVQKKKTNILHEQMEPKLAERRYKMLKVFLLVAGISLAVGIVGVVVHNAIYGLSGVEEPVFFVIALVGLWAFLIATIGGLVIFLKGRRKTT